MPIISSLPVATSVNPSDVLPILQAGTTKQASVNQLVNTNPMLIGATTEPDVSGSQWPWQHAQAMITGAGLSANAALAIVGDYRFGLSGERASTYFGNDGEMYTNRFIILQGKPFTNVYDPSTMITVAPDTSCGIAVKSDQTDPNAGGPQYLYTGGGAANNAGNFLRSFSVGTQGTLELDNVYGTIGAAPTYSRPQIILGDIHNAATPSWTYAGIRLINGTLNLGPWNGTTLTSSVNIQGTAPANALTISSTGISAGSQPISTSSSILAGGGFKTTATTVAFLPSTPTTGQICSVSDGTAGLAWGATVTGGGTTPYLVWWNGTAWTVLGK